MSDEIKLSYEEPTLGTATSVRGEDRIETVWGHIRVVTSVPTWTPKDRLDDAIAIYGGGSYSVLYLYDFTNNRWTTPTTVAKNGSSALLGPITLSAGTGVSLNQSGQDIAISSTVTSNTPKFYWEEVTASRSFSVAETFDSTFTPGFQMRFGMFFGHLKLSSFGSGETVPRYDDAVGSAGLIPALWSENEGHKGIDTTSGTSEISNTALYLVSDASNGFDVKVADVTSTTFDLRFNHNFGASSRTLYWRYLFIAFGYT